jgi:hypothetical protein
MSLFTLFQKKQPDDFEMRKQLVGLIMDRLTKGNRIRAEDAICAAATIVGERCIDVAGDYPLREHDLTPGSRIFSDRVNELLCGDQADTAIANLPPQSVYGVIRASLSNDSYPDDKYPTLTSVFGGYAAGVGKAEDWGKVPVTVLPHNHPSIVPLQFGFETRDKVDAILHSIASDKPRCLVIASNALAALLNRMIGTIAPDVALRLAFEITNGMAKTAPMTKKAFAAAQKSPTR